MSDEPGLTGQSEAEIFAEMSQAVSSNDYTAIDRIATDKAPLESETLEPKVQEADKTPEPAALEEDKDKAPAKAGDEAKALDGEKDAPTELQQLKDELAQRDKQIHQLRSDAGRVPALQRQLSDLDKKLKEMATKPSTPASAREDTRVLSEKLAQIKEADPLLAEAVEEAIKAAIHDLRQDTDTKLAQTQEVLNQRAAKEEDEYLDREYTKLLEAVPNAPQVFAHPLWEEWKSQIPTNLLALAKSNTADEVMVAFEQFSKFVLARHPELAPKAEVKPVEENKAANDTAAKIAADRENKLKTPTPGSAKVVMERDSEPTDPQKLFEHFYKQNMPPKR